MAQRLTTSRRTTALLLACVGVASITSALGAGYSQITGGEIRYGLVAGFHVGFLLAAFELFVVQSPTGVRLRRLPLLAFVTVATFVWAVLIYFGIYVSTPYLLGIDMGGYELDVRDIKGLAFAFALAFLSTFFLRIQSLIGPRVLFSFLLGRYHEPSREDRVFMFLDIADSTRLAEESGDEKIQALIGQFFFDIARPIAEHDGETYRYIGDEVVVSWPLERAVEGARCLRCVVEVQDLLAARSGEYRRRFGVVPRFRIGMHGGPVVIGEVGDSRRAIVYFGETVSIAVALQGACKQAGCDFLVSADLMERLHGDEHFESTHVGPLALFADGSLVDAYALSRADRESEGERP